MFKYKGISYIAALSLLLSFPSQAAEPESQTSGLMLKAGFSEHLNMISNAVNAEVSVQQAGNQVTEQLKSELSEHVKVQVDQTEKELLASIIFCEAGNQSFAGQVAVGAVVMNRMRSASFPSTMEGVIYQSGQFAPVASGWLDRVRGNSGYTQSALEAAEAALTGENPVGDCLFFDQGGYGMQIGAHYFH